MPNAHPMNMRNKLLHLVIFEKTADHTLSSRYWSHYWVVNSLIGNFVIVHSMSILYIIRASTSCHNLHVILVESQKKESLP